MHPFEIFFHNNGDATFQTDDFCHVYDDMVSLARDFSVYQATGNTDYWEGNEPDYRHAYDPEMERNGAYRYINDANWTAQLDQSFGYNVQTFFSKILLD